MKKLLVYTGVGILFILLAAITIWLVNINRPITPSYSLDGVKNNQVESISDILPSLPDITSEDLKFVALLRKARANTDISICDYLPQPKQQSILQEDYVISSPGFYDWKNYCYALVKKDSKLCESITGTVHPDLQYECKLVLPELKTSKTNASTGTFANEVYTNTHYKFKIAVPSPFIVDERAITSNWPTLYVGRKSKDYPTVPPQGLEITIRENEQFTAMNSCGNNQPAQSIIVLNPSYPKCFITDPGGEKYIVRVLLENTVYQFICSIYDNSYIADCDRLIKTFSQLKNR